ncbi:hypothetical protein LOD99_7855 [Oopsacas minuta]|uniref:HTH psq-type domain-containing protein n=1 Tax=Oopsacas minuta TaxID=111878 RepID=A0AAV7JPQ2_9METZ|nr:hypothetical protein LOD99_7847 [Oopsacas minuta]KAI6650804.1 hypothetical protein LOD99_7855 [Oopsacas minuta]
MSGKGKGKRLNESQRSNVIAKFSEPTPPSKRSLAREYEVSKGAIRKVWKNREVIRKRSALLSEQTKTKSFEVLFVGFRTWKTCYTFGLMACAVLTCLFHPLWPSQKQSKSLNSYRFRKDDFKTSWQWLSRFRER